MGSWDVPRPWVPKSAPSLVSGTKLGRYQILRHIASGGMAEIYLARVVGIEGFEKIVVLKRVLPHLVGDQRFVEMFLGEARLAATLQHPNIVQVYDVGFDRDQHFFAMEHVFGEDLRAISQSQFVESSATGGEKPVPLENALAIVIGVACGVHYAHERAGPDGKPLDLVHRDISPSNILVSYDGGVKVTDFGIAKVTQTRRETRTGMVKGKVSYMSPEQCRGEKLDRRSDIFSLGIILYELTVGRQLYTGESDFAIMEKIVYRPPDPPSAHRRDYPPELERIVMKALSRNVEERQSTAQEVQVELESFAREHKLPVSTVSLARYMRELFGYKLDAWRRAEEAGQSLADHLASADQGYTTAVPAANPAAFDATVPALETPVPTPAPATPAPTTPAAPIAAVAPPRRTRRGLVLAAAVALASAVAVWLARREAPLAVPPPAVPAAPSQVELALERERRGDPEGCAVALRRWLAGPSPGAAERPHALEGLARCRAAARIPVRVTSTPPGARVVVGGAQGVTPFELAVPPGEHSITVSHEGHLTQTQTVTVEVGERPTLDVRLEPFPVKPPPPRRVKKERLEDSPI